MRDYNKLKAFQLAEEITVMVYKFTQNFPTEERFGLTSQIWRSAISIPSNIVEGSSRISKKEYLRFLEIAYGSLKELQYQCKLASKLNFVSEKDLEVCSQKCHEASKVLGSLIIAVKTL